MIGQKLQLKLMKHDCNIGLTFSLLDWYDSKDDLSGVLGDNNNSPMKVSDECEFEFQLDYKGDIVFGVMRMKIPKVGEKNRHRLTTNFSENHVAYAT